MDELINLVSQRTGIPADKAQMAVQTVVGFLKERLPAPIAAEVDSFMAGGVSGLMSELGNLGNLGDMGSMVKGIEGMFGKEA
jgi:hypothetical protein